MTILSCQSVEDDIKITEPISPKDKQLVLSFVNQNLKDECTLLSSSEQSKSARLSREMEMSYVNSSIAQDDINSIVSRRDKLKSSDIEFTNSSVRLDETATTFTLENGYAILRVAANYRLPTNSKDTETGRQIVSEGIDYYNFKIQKTGNKYFIVDKSKVADFPISEVFSEALGSGTFQEGNRGGANSRIAATYDKTNAVNFAITKYNNPPTTGYYDYSSSGGDCTNFLSHCLKSGGWTQVNAWFWANNGASGNSMTQYGRSPSWTGAAQFYEYITNTGASRVTSKFSDIEVYYWYSLPSTVTTFKNATSVVNTGDIVQLSTTTAKSTVHHSTIVTSKDANAQKIFVTYRNATGYPVAKDKFVGDFTGGQYIHGFTVKSSF